MAIGDYRIERFSGGDTVQQSNFSTTETQNIPLPNPDEIWYVERAFLAVAARADDPIDNSDASIHLKVIGDFVPEVSAGTSTAGPLGANATASDSTGEVVVAMDATNTNLDEYVYNEAFDTDWKWEFHVSHNGDDSNPFEYEWHGVLTMRRVV